MKPVLDTKALITALKAAAEPTRLRILLLLRSGELTVKDLTEILGQSQPRISRHLKLLFEAGLLDRFRDGSWVYFHVSDRSEGGSLTRRLLEAVHPDDPIVRRDGERAAALKRDREKAAQSYFHQHAAQWDQLRVLHVSEREVEGALLKALGPGPFKLLLDLGTGTGRVLELAAERYERGLGIDVNQPMLALARAKLDTLKLDHAQVRHGDLYHIALADGVADAVVMHQVLHYLSEPHIAIREAARVLAPGGRLVIADFAPHELEFLREQHAHDRLGFSHEQVEQWIRESGLTPLGVTDLPPHARDMTDQLTVTIWVGERTAPGVRDAQGPRLLERLNR